MKVSIFVSLFFLTHYVSAQTFASAEPSNLYEQVNQSLAEGNTKDATGIFKQVIEFYETEGRLKEVPENYMGMALALAFSGHYNESIKYHKKALRAHHRYRPHESDDSIRMNLGLTYQLAGKYRKAKRWLQN